MDLLKDMKTLSVLLEGMEDKNIVCFWLFPIFYQIGIFLYSAIDKGTDMLELDVWLTKDGKVVVFHDPDLSRLTMGRNIKRISDVEYKELPRLNYQVPIDTIPSNFYYPCTVLFMSVRK